MIFAGCSLCFQFLLCFIAFGWQIGKRCAEIHSFIARAFLLGDVVHSGVNPEKIFLNRMRVCLYDILMM